MLFLFFKLQKYLYLSNFSQTHTLQNFQSARHRSYGIRAIWVPAMFWPSCFRLLCKEMALMFQKKLKQKNAQSTHKWEPFAMHSRRKFKRKFHQSNPGPRRIDFFLHHRTWKINGDSISKSAGFLGIHQSVESVESQNTGCKWNVINSSSIILCRNSKQIAKLWGFEADVSLNGQSSLSCAKESKMSATFTIWLPSFCHEEKFWPLWQKCFPTFGKKSPLGGEPNSKRYVKVFPESCMCPWKLEKCMVSTYQFLTKWPKFYQNPSMFLVILAIAIKLYQIAQRNVEEFSCKQILQIQIWIIQIPERGTGTQKLGSSGSWWTSHAPNQLIWKISCMNSLSFKPSQLLQKFIHQDSIL